jgi:hypothetical protein
LGATPTEMRAACSLGVHGIRAKTSGTTPWRHTAVQAQPAARPPTRNRGRCRRGAHLRNNGRQVAGRAFVPFLSRWRWASRPPRCGQPVLRCPRCQGEDLQHNGRQYPGRTFTTRRDGVGRPAHQDAGSLLTRPRCQGEDLRHDGRLAARSRGRPGSPRRHHAHRDAGSLLSRGPRCQGEDFQHNG